MKKLMLIILVSVFVYSCDKSATVSVEVVNKSVENIEVAFYSKGVETVHQISTGASVLLSKSGSFGATDVYLTMTEDSVIVKTISNRTIKYYDDNLDNEKSIYNETDWHKEEVSKRNYKYSFIIMEEDFNN